MYKTILVPLENSPADETILRHIRQLARHLGSELILVHVADGFVARNQEPLNLEDSEEIRQDRAYLERRRSELEADGYGVTTHLLLGEPAKEITRLAEETACDLIAMCTHGHRLIQDILRGSVASEVRHQSRVPVLMVRMEEVAQ